MAETPEPTLPDPEEKPTIPLEPVAEGDPPARGTSSILNPSGDACPNCGAGMAAEAVVCMACGYDMTANRVVTPRTGVDEVDPEPEDQGPAEFVRPGGKPMVLAIAGAVVLLAAAVAAGSNAPRREFSAQAAMVLLVLYRAVIHTGTGLAAVWCAARYVEERFGSVRLALARVFVAVAVFWLVSSLRLPIESEWLERAVRWPVALGCYWLTLFVLFRRSRGETLVLALLHVGTWMFVEMGIQLGVWLQDAAGK
ncbi:MAG TPA: zinc ribbon domain-containing protein [Phycisphaerales bacterium]|nr:zinc ribbon domain-containing protein [Phycisphaerales bacterium]